MHGKLVILAAAAAGVVSRAVAMALERSHVALERLSSFIGREER